MNKSNLELEYLKLLSKSYPNIQSAATEAINLQAILNLPKGTEHFISDLHGENAAFIHILKTAAGVIKEKIDDLFSKVLSETERKSLATLVYYPEEKLAFLRKNDVINTDWYRITLYRLIELCRVVASKYTRSKVRKALPKDFCYIIDELIHTEDTDNKHAYYTQIIQSIIDIGSADAFIIAMSNLIQRLSIDHLHIIGDIYDRGPRADLIVDKLIHYHSLDIQWGNHDILWIGAAAGEKACIANVIRNIIRYGNFDILEDGYGISLRPLSDFAIETYKDDPCTAFYPTHTNHTININSEKIQSKMYKAISIIQFKLEGKLINRHPEYKMSDRKLLDKINAEDGSITINDVKYELKDTNFPTIDFKDPYELTVEEEEVIKHLRHSFLHSEKLQKHIRFIISKGSMFSIYNNNLLFHGCVPLKEDGTLETINFLGKCLKGKEYFEESEKAVRRCFYNQSISGDDLDFIWYLWCGKLSPLFGKEKMATFEKLFINNEKVWFEEKNAYYDNTNNPEIIINILKEFGIENSEAHIINGHMPVKTKNGESPIKAGGKLFVIDGGLSKEYQSVTGIAGYTLIFNSYGYKLVKHTPFSSVTEVIEDCFELHSTAIKVEERQQRLYVKDTDIGKNIQKNIDMLKNLLLAYHNGIIKEQV